MVSHNNVLQSGRYNSQDAEAAESVARSSPSFSFPRLLEFSSLYKPCSSIYATSLALVDAFMIQESRLRTDTARH